MTDFDKSLGAALDADDRAFLASLDARRGLFAQMGDTMAGPLGGWAKLMLGVSVALGFALVLTVYQAVTAVELRETVLWSAASLAILVMQGFAKEWFFGRINLLAVLREVKRVELRLARMEDARG
ncbi:DUF6768 family protein [Stakelama tenebrarum]|uniref:Uncharacterized protein n=1 Tax=Stakelama tenebrarum TaxID=2711215 RepID=A0A6G6Y6Y3_9SPHN|nr:DUF6768 family protein [Sphingosinithalassobacter tenebrarum]QIG80669.1 hypothetical protein G5C33_13355 [Sphingosinithalassobacter tenebrarum]